MKNITRHPLTSLSNKLTALLVLLMVAILIVMNSRSVMAASNAQESTEQILLVRFDANTTPESRDAVIAQMGGQLITWMAQINVAEVRLPLQEGVAAVSVASDMITFAEQDMVVSGVGVFNDPDFSDETMNYALNDVAAVEAWSVITGSQDIVIAVVDSGVQLDHPEFAGRLVAGYDFVNDDDQPEDEAGHGTHVAGIIAAGLNNGQGVAGVCPNCRLMPVKVLNKNNMGSWSKLSQGILFAVDNGAKVINLSLGASVNSQTMAAAVDYAVQHGVVVVAAAGNYGSNEPFYPAALDGVIAVSATDSNNVRWSKSNFGSYIDLSAPGALVYSTYNDMNNLYHGYTYMSGTSMAAPFVSGVAGLLLSANHELTVAQVTDTMIVSAKDLGSAGWDVEFGYGRVDALAALTSPAVGLSGEFIETPRASTNVQMFMPVLNNN